MLELQLHQQLQRFFQVVFKRLGNNVVVNDGLVQLIVKVFMLCGCQ
jgi:hypothetical protein